MQRRLFVGAHWKSNGTVGFIKDFAENTLNKIIFDPTKVDLVVAPTTLHMAAAKAHIKTTSNFLLRILASLEMGLTQGKSQQIN